MKYQRFQLLLILLLFVGVEASMGQVRDMKVDKNETLHFTLHQTPIQISLFNNTTVEIKALNTNKVIDTKAIFAENQHIPHIKNTHYGAIIEGTYWIAKVNKEPFSIRFFKKRDLLNPFAEVMNIVYKEAKLQYDLKVKPNEQIYGGGARAISMDRRGETLKLHNEPHYSYGWGEKNLNFSQPLFFSSNNYSIFYNSGATGFADICDTKKNTLSIGSGYSGNALYITIGEDPKDLHHQFAKLVGTAPLPPRWALGNLMSRFGYTSQRQAEEMIEKMQAEEVPVDAIILDLYWFGYGQKEWRMGDLKWNTDSFPTHRKMIQKFKKKGIQTILIAEPFILESTKSHKDAEKANALGLNKDGDPFIIEKFWFGKASLVDIFSDAGKKWFWNKYNPLIKEGVSAWWGDLGEPEMHPDGIHYQLGTTNQIHNIYGHYWSKMLSDEYAKNYPNTRLFHLNRAGFVGTQRFSSFPWSGDVSRSWRGLKPQIPIMLGLSMGQIPYASSDLGGFCAGPQNNELYTRWLQFGVFNPIYRPHGADVPSEVVEYPDSVKRVVKKAINLRYQLMPYNYNLTWQQTKQGTALASPWFFENDIPKEMWDRDDVYMWGPSFLVYPVLEEGQKTKEMFLPNGIWFNFYNDDRYLGNSNITLPLTLDHIPVFVKAGSFIPMVESFQNTQHYNTKKLTMHYYADRTVGESTYTWFNDDGKGKNNLQNNQFETLDCKINQTSEGVTLETHHTGSLYNVAKSKTRTIQWVFHNVDNPVKVLINNQVITLQSEYNSEVKTLTIEIDQKENQKIELKY
ncbi:DUF5110 domain-containing protein [Halosquirtibacter laminarini]|uniref:DUF5110 domain-containing protein n=1 Tax=Halosquirtibacter laminarini TaxID=3374600 RepID=A0AC61NEK0_9BACT|nr:DUF5110 domain-containing protein [Prolixibacteraceae bacterium]